MDIHSKDLKQLHHQLKAGAKKRNIPFHLTVSDLYDLSFPLTCPVLGIPLKFNTGAPEDNSYSVDRIDSSKGYEPGNIVVVSARANTLKSNATLEEMTMLVEFYSNLEV